MKKILYILIFVITLVLTNNAFAAYYPFPDIELNGIEFSDISNITPYSEYTGGQTWFADGDGTSIYTFWDDAWVEYETYLSPGTWNIGLNATNAWGNTDLYASYLVHENLTDTIIPIPASTTDVNNNYIHVTIPYAGDYSIKYLWINDVVFEGTDSNLKIKSAFFDKVGPVVPEPTSIFLFLTGILGLLGFSKRKII